MGSFYLDTDDSVFVPRTDEAGFPQVQLLEPWRIAASLGRQGPCP